MIFVDGRGEEKRWEDRAERMVGLSISWMPLVRELGEILLRRAWNDLLCENVARIKSPSM